MSGLFGSLSASVQALNAQSLQLSTAGKNLANVSNPNYARQRVVLGDLGTVQTPQGAQSTGLQALRVQQLRDAFLDRMVTREISTTADLEARQSAYDDTQAALGQSIDSSQASTETGSVGAGQGVSTALTDFFNAFDSFASSPTDSGVRQSLIQKTGILDDTLALSDRRLGQLQDDLTTQLNTDVDAANTLLKRLADLNAQIGRLKINAPGSAVDLRDQRQQALKELAQKMSFSTRDSATATGEIDIFAYDASGNEVPLVNLASVTGPLTLSGSTFSAGSPATALSLTGGSLKGNLEARDTVIQPLRDQLDAVAGQLVTAVNAIYNPTGTTGNFFDPAGTTAGTITLAGGLTATNLKASASGAAGDNDIASAIAALGDKSFSTAAGDAIDGTFNEYFGNAVINLGQAASAAKTELDTQTNIQAIVSGHRDGVSAVSLDEEAADLVKFQRAYQASARVIQIYDTLLDTIIHLGA